MAKMPPFLIAALMFACASCAPAPITPPPQQTSSLTGKLTEGTVVTVRSISLAPSGGAMAGVNAVLYGLRLPPTAEPVAASEVVIRRDDHSPVSLIQPPSSLLPGERIAIVEAATTTLHPD